MTEADFAKAFRRVLLVPAGRIPSWYVEPRAAANGTAA
jgi:hypothetical protein